MWCQGGKRKAFKTLARTPLLEDREENLSVDHYLLDNFITDTSSISLQENHNPQLTNYRVPTHDQHKTYQHGLQRR
jgi:hypothetical protein